MCSLFFLDWIIAINLCKTPNPSPQIEGLALGSCCCYSPISWILDCKIVCHEKAYNGYLGYLKILFSPIVALEIERCENLSGCNNLQFGWYLLVGQDDFFVFFSPFVFQLRRVHFYYPSEFSSTRVFLIWLLLNPPTVFHNAFEHISTIRKSMPSIGLFLQYYDTQNNETNHFFFFFGF